MLLVKDPLPNVLNEFQTNMAIDESITVVVNEKGDN